MLLLYFQSTLVIILLISMWRYLIDSIRQSLVYFWIIEILYIKTIMNCLTYFYIVVHTINAVVYSYKKVLFTWLFD